MLIAFGIGSAGGLPGAAMVGREVTQMICAEADKRFVTTKPKV
jgi:hypothetical protein